jgi:hypothetical protein
MRIKTTAVILLLLISALSASNRNLILVNGTGETADWIDLGDSSITVNIDNLGITPNDFLVYDSVGVAVNSGSSDLYIYELPAMVQTDAVFLGSNRNPWSGVWIGRDTLLVTNWLTSTVSKVDVAGGSLIGEYAIGVPAENINHPQEVLIVERKAYITMSCFNDEFVYFPGKVEVFDIEGDTTLGRIDVGLNPQAISLGPDGYLYVICTGNYWDVFGVLYKIDPESDSVVDSLEIGGQPGNIDITRNGIAFLSAGGWEPWGKSQQAKTPNMPVGTHVALYFNQDGRYVYCAYLSGWSVLR